MSNKINCLDFGFVKLLNISSAIPREPEYIPNGIDNFFQARDIDSAICARISFNNFEEERTEEQDLRLIEYLIKNNHWTPIEMTEVWLEMKLPIFLARQFVRHRTATLNEVSGRYVTLPEEWYIPEVVGGKAISNKQGQEDNLAIGVQKAFKSALNTYCQDSYDNYLHYLNLGVAPEHARMFLHLNHYTHWIWKQDLRNMLGFLKLRLDNHAQIEARCYAQAILTLLKQYLPKTIELAEKHLL